MRGLYRGMISCNMAENMLHMWKHLNFSFFISSLFWWHLRCVLPENQVRPLNSLIRYLWLLNCWLAFCRSLTHIEGSRQECGSSLDSAADSGASWSGLLILFLTLLILQALCILRGSLGWAETAWDLGHALTFSPTNYITHEVSEGHFWAV